MENKVEETELEGVKKIVEIVEVFNDEELGIIYRALGAAKISLDDPMCGKLQVIRRKIRDKLQKQE